MTRSVTLLSLGAALLLAACNQNTAPGNDREAKVDYAPAAAPRMSAAEALSGIATGAVQPETMNEPDLASLGGLAGNCVIRLTGIAYPSFFEDSARDTGYVKLNGKLVELKKAGDDRYVDGKLTVRLRSAPDDESDNGLPGMEMIVALPGARDELGFRGYRDCGAKTG